MQNLTEEQYILNKLKSNCADLYNLYALEFRNLKPITPIQTPTVQTPMIQTDKTAKTTIIDLNDIKCDKIGTFKKYLTDLNIKTLEQLIDLFNKNITYFGDYSSRCNKFCPTYYYLKEIAHLISIYVYKLDLNISENRETVNKLENANEKWKIRGMGQQKKTQYKKAVVEDAFID